MSQKRKHSESLDDSNAAPKSFKKPRAFKPGQNHQSQHRKRPNFSNDNDDNTRSTNALKSRIRDLKRLLAHVENVPKHKMSAGARQERERELEAAEHELAEKLNSSREAEYRKKMIGKYHQVRFFDRQKATRILKRLKKEASSLDDTSQKADFEKKIHNAEVDVNYAIYYPLMKPYSSLYPKSKKQKDAPEDGEAETDGKSKSQETDGPKGDVEMWRAVEHAMEEGTLDALRNSKDAIPAAPRQKSKATKDKQLKKDKLDKKDKAHAKKQENSSHHEMQEEDEESDGGFFE